MSRLLPALLLALVAGAACAQQNITLSGVVESEEALPDATRVSLQVLNADDAWVHEAASTTLLGGSFELDVGEAPPEEHLRTFRSGGVLLPGLQNEYRVQPEGVAVTRASLALYVDENGDGSYDREPEPEPHFLALAQLDEPVGFFTALYVDQAATLEGTDATVELAQGWNVFAVRFPDTGPAFGARASLTDVTLEVLDLVER